MTAKRSPVLVLLLAILVVWFTAGNALAAQSPQVPLAGSAIPQFVQELPTLQTNTQSVPKIQTVFGNEPLGTGSLTLTMCEFDANILPPGTPLAAGATGTTRVWGYIVGNTCPTTPQDTYIGPVIVNNRNYLLPPPEPGSTDITFVNALGNASLDPALIGTPGYTGVLAWLYAVDQTLMWADPLNNELNQCKVTGGIPGPGTPCAQNYEGPIPAVPHLHGGEIPPELDGGPDAWFTSDGLSQGHGYYSAAGAPGNGALYKYPNTQEAGPIWFHDHLLGGTRLNVYMGLAGAYYIQDLDQIPIADGGNCDPAATPPQDCLPVGLQALGDVVPLVIQDRMFDNNGQLFFPSDSGGGVLWTSNPEHPYWVAEFVGDTIAVNGKVWPYLNVEPKRYRFVFINGSNARTYQLSLPNPVTGTNVPIQIIATDGGYLDAPVPVNKLVIMPGERYEAIIDFAGMAGSTLVMKNNARTPYPKGATPQGSTLGRIVQFRVVLPLAAPDTSYNPAAVPTVPLRPASLAIHRLPGAPGGPAIVTAVGATQNVQVTRQLTLNEVLLPPNTVTDPVTGALTAYPGGPLEALLNNSTYDGKSPRTFVDYTPITIPGFVNSETWYFETPQEGDTEVWELVNLTGDAHPIHLHLVQFQVIDRRNFDLGKYNAFYNTLFPAVPGDAVCTGGVYCPGFGPPLNYLTGNPRALGGNPDVTPYLKGKATPALPEEQGWKDTVVAYPGQVTRLAVRWAPTSLPVTTAAADLYFPFDPLGTTHHGYVWHCHIVDHEDNEMMRPNMVPLNSAAPAPASRPLVRGVAY